MRFLHQIVVFVFTLIGAGTVFLSSAQEKTETPEEEYTRIITQRADKIVEKIDFKSDTLKTETRDFIVGFYRGLNRIQDFRDAKIFVVKENGASESLNEEIENITKESEGKTNKLHCEFLKNLAQGLSPEQIGQVKDGLTYGVAPNTFKVYQEMIPDLTETQKKQIWEWLVEAREHAMDGGSSKEKHAWFGKYKGRINNYLSAEGYDLKKAGKE